MRRVIAAFNMTLDGICDHTTGIADDELHQHYSDLLDRAGVLLYGKNTFQLMKFWQDLLQNPSEKKTMNQFASSIDNIEKIVFSTTLKETGWPSAKIARKSLPEVLDELKQQSGKDILVGSRGLIIQLLNSQLIDEFQISVHPVIEGKGLRLFDQISERILLKLSKTKQLSSGVTVFYYQPVR